MARPIRIEYPGALYHFSCRCDGHEALYKPSITGPKPAWSSSKALMTALRSTSSPGHAYVRSVPSPLTGNSFVPCLSTTEIRATQSQYKGEL